MVRPVAVEYLDTPCHAVALFDDGTVRVSGLHCLKGTHASTLVNGNAQAASLTAFGGVCDPVFVPDAATLLAALALVETQAHDDLVVASYVGASVTYVETWDDPCVGG